VSQASERPGIPGPGEEPYDALVARLERVVADLEGGGLTLEQSIEKFAEGVRLAREASRKLDEAERRVEMLVRSADGEVRVTELDAEGRGTGPDAGR
jgi:exodeoxyribonuclease VII small subunit